MNSALREELNNIRSNGFRDGFNVGLRDDGVWIEGDGLDLKMEEMGSWSKSCEDKGMGLLVSGFRGVPDRFSREAKSCSRSAEAFFASTPCLLPGDSEPFPSVTP